MVAVDTNILVRLLVGDDAGQYRTSLKLFEAEAIFIPDTVILETEWVLRAAYDQTPAEVCDALRSIFGLPNVTVSNALSLAQTLAWHEAGLDFADAFHLSLSQGREALKTFDTDFIKRAKVLSACRVEKP